MNWQTVKNLTHVQVGAFLALLIVAVMPNFGLKYGASPALPSSVTPTMATTPEPICFLPSSMRSCNVFQCSPDFTAIPITLSP